MSGPKPPPKKIKKIQGTAEPMATAMARFILLAIATRMGYQGHISSHSRMDNFFGISSILGGTKDCLVQVVILDGLC